MDASPLNAADREELMGCLLAVARVHHDRLNDGAARLGLTVPQARVLYFLESAPTVRKLAKKLDCDPSYITGIVDRLEEMKFVTRLVDEDDRRVKRLVLTPIGRRTRRQVAKVISDSFEIDGLVPAEAEQFATLLRKIRLDAGTAAW
jgi:DNA-binding MarR family transcriptional regulator